MGLRTDRLLRMLWCWRCMLPPESWPRRRREDTGCFERILRNVFSNVTHGKSVCFGSYFLNIYIFSFCSFFLFYSIIFIYFHIFDWKNHCQSRHLVMRHGNWKININAGFNGNVICKWWIFHQAMFDFRMVNLLVIVVCDGIFIYKDISRLTNYRYIISSIHYKSISDWFYPLNIPWNHIGLGKWSHFSLK